MNTINWMGKAYNANKVKMDGYNFKLETINFFLSNGTITRYSSRGGYLNFYTTGTAGKSI